MNVLELRGHVPDGYACGSTCRELGPDRVVAITMAIEKDQREGLLESKCLTGFRETLAPRVRACQQWAS
jgi:hypothetical protein